MRKIFIGLFAIAMAVSANALTEPQTKKMDDNYYHWFSPSGTYLGYYLESVQRSLCSGSGSVCARGYTEIDAQQQPIGSPLEVPKT
jgi:hypothetical protein